MKKEYASKLDEVREALNGLITNETSNELINAIGGIKGQIDELANIHDKTEKDLSDIKDLYIGAIKKEGSKEAPKDDNPVEPKAKSLEELASEVIANRKS